MGLLDAPCGDWFWMPHCLETIAAHLLSASRRRPDRQHLTRICYRGFDVAAAAVDAAAAQVAVISRLKRLGVLVRPFVQLDISAPGELARATNGEQYDIVLINDAMMHMTLADVGSTLQGVNALARDAKTRYLVANDHPYERRGSNPNRDIVRGHWRPLSLTRPPFFLTPIASVKSDEPSGREAIVTIELPLKWPR